MWDVFVCHASEDKEPIARPLAHRQAELGALISKESSDRRVVLPVWYKITAEEVRRHSPLLADRVAARWDEGEDAVAAKLLEVLRPSQASVATLHDLATLDSLRSKLTV